MPTLVLDAYLRQVRATINSGAATDERSHYPALKALLNQLGAKTDPKVRAETDPAGVGGSFPDLAVIEVATNVLVLPVEAKPPNWSIQRILDQPKTTTYANSFGGGRVLVTNIHTFALAEVDSTGALSVLDEVQAVAPSDLSGSASPPGATDDELAALLGYGTEVRATIARPQQVAHHLAEHAAAMREQISNAGDAKDLLAPIWSLFESGLGAELDEEFFVPTVVQTLVYGLFAGWLGAEEDSAQFDWQSASYRVDVPLFADVLHASLRPYLIRKCNLFPRLAAVAGVLRRVDRDKFTAALSGGAIEYFYEPFLAAFDPELRDRLGVWYTPREVAEFQVAACDHQLRTELGIAAGLADDSVIILDPAVGTGTYLSAVYRFIHDRHVANGEAPAVAASRAKAAALTRVVGFEILPAAFIVCHLSLSRVLDELGAPLEGDERLSVYLTNSLTGWDPARNESATTLFPELDEELEEARRVKQREPVIAIIGNPPYEGYSSAESPEEKELVGPWIEPLWSKWGVRKHRLNDLYARFWAASVRRIELTGRGVVSFITNRQWLTGRSYPEMRADIVATFDHVLVIDLHGAVHDRTHPGDQSIFTTNIADGIKVGTAIVTATRRDGATPVADVVAAELRGSADDKRSRLVAWSPSPTSPATAIPMTEDRKWRFSAHAGTDFPFLDDYFLINDRDESFFSGVQPGRGGVATDHDRGALVQRMTDYFDGSISYDDLIVTYPELGHSQAGYDPKEVRRKLLGRASTTPEGGFADRRLKRFLYRPFEARWLYWEPEHKFLTRPRPTMIPFWGIDGQRALVTPQTRRREGAARPLVCSQVPCNEVVDPNAKVFPLWRPDALAAAGGGATVSKRPAIAPEWIDAARLAGLSGTDADIGETLFYAIAGVGASDTWLSTQEMHADDLPSIPIPSTAADLQAAADVGRRYADLIDPDVDVPGVTSGVIQNDLRNIGTPDSIAGAGVLTKGQFGHSGGERRDGHIYWDDQHAWRDVPEDVWRFSVGGFSVLSKWLSYRVGTSLSQGDREEVMHLVRRIKAIQLLRTEADASFTAAASVPLAT